MLSICSKLVNGRLVGCVIDLLLQLYATHNGPDSNKGYSTTRTGLQSSWSTLLAQLMWLTVKHSTTDEPYDRFDSKLCAKIRNELFMPTEHFDPNQISKVPIEGTKDIPMARSLNAFVYLSTKFGRQHRLEDLRTTAKQEPSNESVNSKRTLRSATQMSDSADGGVLFQESHSNKVEPKEPFISRKASPETEVLTSSGEEDSKPLRRVEENCRSRKEATKNESGKSMRSEGKENRTKAGSIKRSEGKEKKAKSGTAKSSNNNEALSDSAAQSSSTIVEQNVDKAFLESLKILPSMVR